jgi:DNA replication and repair protein RecF
VDLEMRNFRNYAQARVSLADGVTVLHGPVGAGKTNLLEALYFACVGKSPRTNNDRDLIRFGERAAHVAATSVIGGIERTHEVGIEPGRAKVVKVDGSRLEPATQRPLLCVFMPDRLELVKGAASLRRPHLDALVAALWPPRRATRVRYARAVAQRNVLLARVRTAAASSASLASWNRELAVHGIALMGDRAAAIDLLAPRFRDRARELGLEGETRLAYRARSKAATVEALERELEEATDTDLARGFTTHGPHRDDFRLEAGGRELRRFGSQGQQRLALLALLIAERDALGETRGEPPILLLDDVLSELDLERRRRLLESLLAEGQALITTADLDAVVAAGHEVDTIAVAEGRVGG